MVTGAGLLRRSPFGWLTRVLEALAVLASPGVCYAVLRLRGMALVQLPDPSMHTTFIVDPRDMFTRYAAAFASTARLREGARVGFLVPARLAYLAFGAVGGFFTFRYVLALVAVVPLYLLLSRTHGRWAGAAAIAVVMSNPVFVTAWGTDYPDSAAISYLTAGLCALVMPAASRRRPWWLAAAAAAFSLAVWAHGAAVPLVAAALVAYGIVRLARERSHLVRDTAVLGAVALATTGLLVVASGLLLGEYNFISLTWEAARYLATPAQVAIWHSANWRWVLYDTYLLVPPAALAACAVVLVRHGRRLGTPQAFAGLAALLAFGTAAWLQFVGTVQMVEMFYFSSLLWSFVALLVAFTLAELAAPFVAGARGGHATSSRLPAGAARTVRAVLPALLVLGVALAYEADPHVPVMKPGTWGWRVALIVVAAALVWLAATRLACRPRVRRLTAGVLRDAVPLAALVVVAGALLILTVAHEAGHPQLPNTSKGDVVPAYAAALGGSDTAYVDEYQVVSELPAFAGHATYAGEQLLTWWPEKDTRALIEPIGMFHAEFNAVTGPFPNLVVTSEEKIESRRPAEVLLMSWTGEDFAKAVTWLAPFGPDVVRKGVLSDGGFHLHVWLVDLRCYLHRPPGGRPAICGTLLG
jgi:hypothetical protein